MAGMLTDFFRSMMGQPDQTQGVPFNQLAPPIAPEQQRFAQTDNLSPAEQYLAKQRMLQMRGQTNIRTINPGVTWGGHDKNAIQPNDVMSNGPRWIIDNI